MRRIGSSGSNGGVLRTYGVKLTTARERTVGAAASESISVRVFGIYGRQSSGVVAGFAECARRSRGKILTGCIASVKGIFAGKYCYQCLIRLIKYSVMSWYCLVFTSGNERFPKFGCVLHFCSYR